MKKVLAAAFAVMMLFSSCGWGFGKKNVPAAEQKANVSVSELGEAMLKALSPRGEMIQISERVLPNYYTVDLSNVDSFWISMSSMFQAEEVAVFCVKQGTKAESLRAVLEQRLADMKDSFQNYRDEEYALVRDNAKILTSGRYIVLVCGEKKGCDAAVKAFEKLTK